MTVLVNCWKGNFIKEILGLEHMKAIITTIKVKIFLVIIISWCRKITKMDPSIINIVKWKILIQLVAL